MRTYLLVLTLFLISSNSLALTSEQKGLEIAQKSYEASRGFKGELTQSELVIMNAYGDKVNRELITKTKELPGSEQKSIISFLKPTDVKGTKLLTWGYKDKGDDQWLYLPSLRRVKRISARTRSGAFMGSEFSYEDLGNHAVEKYKYKYLQDEKLNGRETWMLEKYPLDKRSGYSKEVIWMDKEYLKPLKIDYYNRKGVLLKTGFFTGYTKNEKWWQANSTKMVNAQTKKESHLYIKSRKLGQSFSDNDFDSENLRK